MPLEVVELAPGAAPSLTVHDLDQPGEPRVEHLLAALDAAMARARIAAWRCSRRWRSCSATPSAACVHGDLYGTVSASSVIVPDAGAVVYRHAAGRPCEVDHRDVSDLLLPP